MARISRTILHSTEAARRAMATLALTVLLALAASEAHAGIAFVQSLGTNASQSSGTSIAVTLTAAVAAGDTVIVTFAMDPATGTVTCADTKGNTYTADADVTNGSGTSGVRTIVFSAPVTTALVSGNTITVTHPTATARALSVNEFSGLATTAAFDKKASATNTVANMTPSSGSTATISQPVELLIGAIGVEGKSSDTFTAGSGYTALSSTGSGQSGSDGTIYITIDPEYRIVSTAQGYTANGTLGTSRLWAAAIATYKAPTCGNGLVDAGEDCDVALGGACCDATCHFLPSSAVCRAAVAGGCDVAETCTGSSDACPADGFQPSGTVCRASAGSCDVAETCSGSTATCPTDAFLPSGTVCRPALNECDNQETCSGTSATCPADTVKSAGTACSDDGHVCTSDVCNGTVGAPACTHPAKASGTACPDDGNVCTRDVCDGTSLDCTHPAGNAGTVCRAAAGVCDVAETCTGTSATCPADAFVSSSVVCRAAVAGGCDIAENCPGNGPNCPADVVQPNGTVCRAAAGECDLAETCNGTSNTCPADAKKTSGTACTDDGNACTSDTCDGTSNLCQHPAGNPLGTCLTQTQSAAGTCANATGIGTVAWTNPSRAQTSNDSYATAPFSSSGDASNYLKCTNFGFSVPTNSTIQGIKVEWEYSNTSGGTIQDNASRIVKGGTIGTTDKSTATAWPGTDTFVAYGSSADLWSDSWTPSDINSSGFGAALSASQNSGGSRTASVDSVRITVSYVTCGNGAVDAGEQCDDGAANGTAGSCCAANCTFKTSGTACTDDGNPCTTDTCSGSSNLCQHAPGNAGTVCRAAADVCDVAETCTGSSATCPPDGVRPNTFVCRAGSGDICDPSETCDGTSKSCPADVVASSGTVCRGATGECDLAETCSGVAGQPCPSDAKKASGTACTDDGNPCTLDRCDGSNAACQHPAGNAGAICRASAGVCDPAETCTGTSTTCPADAKSPAGTVCGPSGVCDVAPTCDGTSNSCPAGTATTLGAAPASSKFHTSVTLTATVTKCDSTAVTEGSVSFIDGGTCSSPGTTLAGPTAVNGGGQTSLTTSSLSVGTHTITACYSDTPANFGASSGSATETVSARIRII